MNVKQLSVKLDSKEYIHPEEKNFGPFYEVPGGWDYVVEPYKRPTITTSSYRKIKDYKLLSVINMTDSSVVYSAIDSVNEKYVAIKEIFDWFLFEKEVQAYRRVKKHPCVVEIYETFTIGYTGYIVMELLEGNLSSIMELLTLNDIKFIVKQLLYILHYLDRVGVVHFDLHPKNICYTTENKMIQVRLVDFSMSELCYTVKDTNFQNYFRNNPCVKQTSQYRSYLDKIPGSHMDMWSLGCILYEMIHDQVLFEEISDDNTHTENKNIIKGMFKHGVMMDTDDLTVQFIFHLLSRPTASAALEHPWLNF